MSDQPESMLIAKSNVEIFMMPAMANRHGLISGATGTGKTVTLQVLAEQFSSIGVPVFMSDVKGDLTGISMPGEGTGKVQERIEELSLEDFSFKGFPVTLWDIFGEKGHRTRTTISEMGPLLLSRLLNLNDTQTGTLTQIFRIADDNGLLLLDMKDLRSMTQYVGENSTDFSGEYGRISTASIGAIQRGLLTLEEAGGTELFGEPALNIDDLLQSDDRGQGMINILASDMLINSSKIYSTFLLWLLSELFEQLPEIGDPDKPILVFFFDEAHLLFDDAPKVLLDKIEQVVRLIRSKGVGIFFITQNPLDVPNDILGQLGNRVQHSLRAFTPKEQKAVKAIAQTFRTNPDLDVVQTITALGVGEALVSFLDEEGIPTIVEKAAICPPHSRIGPVSAKERSKLITGSILYNHYQKSIDGESAYEILKERAEKSEELAEVEEEIPRKKRGREKDSPLDALLKSAARTAGKQLVRGILGTIFGKR